MSVNVPAHCGALLAGPASGRRHSERKIGMPCLLYTSSTPGHTPGCTSFYFEDTDEATGRVYRCAMHGGLGLNTLSDGFLRHTGLPVSLRGEYRRSMERLRALPVDIALGSHPENTSMLERLKPVSYTHLDVYKRQEYPTVAK